MVLDSNRLGKGLAALISEKKVDNSSKSYVPDMPIAWISANPYQPRVAINPDALMELSDSIRDVGIIQPLLVTQSGERKYTLIAGERRLRAAKLAGKSTVPVVISDISDSKMLEIAVVENIHRKDLNPLEEALAFFQLQRLFGLSQQEIGEKIGLSRVYVVNKMRLLKLPNFVKEAILQELITEGHARALLTLREPQVMESACRVIIEKGLSVRATEEFTRRLLVGYKRHGVELTHKTRKQYFVKSQLRKIAVELEETFQRKVGVPVLVRHTRNGGTLTFRFRNQKDLKRIY